MRFIWALLAVATLSNAYYFPMEGQAPTIAHSRHFQHRRGGPLDEGDVCHVKSVPDQVYDTILNKDDIAYCQAQLLAWTMQNENLVPESTGGKPGIKMTSGTVDCQICNFDSKPVKISPDNLKTLFGAIHCGNFDNPQMGFGYTDALNEQGYYVAYGPKDTLPNCYSCEKKCDNGLENAD